MLNMTIEEHFNKMTISRDGNCMYNSLNVTYGLYDDSMTLRRKIKGFILNNIEHFRANRFENELNGFLETILIDREWGGVPS